MKEEQADVEREERLGGAARDLELAGEVGERQGVGFGGEVAADLGQKFADERAGEVFDAGLLVDAVVEGHGGGEGDEFAFVGAASADGAGAFADKIGPVGFVGGERNAGFVGAGLAAGRPEHEHGAAVDHVGGDDGVVGGLEAVVPEVEKFLLDGVERRGRKSGGRQDGAAVLLGDADDEVAAAEVVEIVGEGGEGVEGVLRVPAGLELEAFPFHGVTVEQGGEIDRERHGRARET